MRGRLVGATAIGLVVLLCTGCAAWKSFGYSGFGRDRWQKPDEVIAALGIRPGDSVADLGAGGGYFTFRLAKATGPEGAVYAVDVDAQMTTYLERRARDEGARNVHVLLAQYDDPLLPEEGVDLIFTCNTYHHLQDRIAYFENVHKYLRSGGRIAIVEFRPQGFFQRIFPHSTSAQVIRREMQGAGYELAQEHAFLDSQSFLVFVRRDG